MIYSGRVIRRIVIVALFLALVGGIVAATIVTWPLVPAVAVLAVLLGGAVLLALQWEWRHRVWQEWERRIGELEYAYGLCPLLLGTPATAIRTRGHHKEGEAMGARLGVLAGACLFQVGKDAISRL